MTPQSVTVLGGGVAGLAVALALARQGWPIRVLEQAPALRGTGAGLQVSPNGAAVLRALGLGTKLLAASLRATAVELRDGPTGRGVLTLDLARRPDRPYHLIPRAGLVGLLAEAARSAGVAVITGCRVQAIDLTGAAPVWSDPAGRVQTAGLLIGADGLHSALRAALNGSSAPFFTHQVAWRATIPAEPDAAPVASVYMAPGRHLVSYPLPGGHRNIVAVEERREWAAEGWHYPDDPDRLRAAFAGFGGPVPGWLAAVETTHLWGLFRHNIARRWHGRGAVLLGDALHPMLPFLAQGANMALEDAWVLADCLTRAPDSATAFAAFQTARAARVARVVAASGENARAYHLRGPMRGLVHAGLRLAGRLAPAAPLARFDWLHGLDVTQA